MSDNAAIARWEYMTQLDTAQRIGYALALTSTDGDAIVTVRGDESQLSLVLGSLSGSIPAHYSAELYDAIRWLDQMAIYLGEGDLERLGASVCQYYELPPVGGREIARLLVHYGPQNIP